MIKTSEEALRTFDLDDLASVELSESFLRRNLGHHFDADISRKTLQEVCRSFVESFALDTGGEWITSLYASLQECDAVLHDIELVLERFLVQLEAIQRDIGDVREALTRIGVALGNTQAAERVLWTAVSRLVVPPETVQVIAQSDGEELGVQFRLNVAVLLRYLRYRKGIWRPLSSATPLYKQSLTATARQQSLGSDASGQLSAVLRDALDASTTMINSNSNGAVATGGVHDAAASTSCVQTAAASSSFYVPLPMSSATAMPWERSRDEADKNNNIENSVAVGSSNMPRHGLRGATEGDGAAHEVRIPLAECRMYKELTRILDGLTLYACVKIRGFLSRKLLVLAEPNTNICIHQSQMLKHYGFYVHFLRSAAPLLRHSAEATPQAAETTKEEEEATATASLDHAVRSLYFEFRREYCILMAEVYLRKMQTYLLVCNTLEYSTTSVTASGFFGGVGTSAKQRPDFVYVLPLLTDLDSATSFLAFRLGERGNVLRRLRSPPLIPAVERASGRRHSYEETFRSVLSLACDIVTHEYLFTVQFFSSDTSVYVEAVRPTVQLIVDYVSEVVLTATGGSGEVRRVIAATPNAALNVNAKHDCYGLLILIRLCYEFCDKLRFERRLGFLGGLYESLLMLLWPAFKTAFARQQVSFRTLSPQDLVRCMRHMHKLEDQLSFVHPVVKCFTDFAAAILGIALGIIPAEERHRRDVAPSDDDDESDDDNSASADNDDEVQGGMRDVSSQPLPARSMTTLSSLTSSSSVTNGSLPAIRDEGGGDEGDAWTSVTEMRLRALERIAEENAMRSDAADGESHLTLLLSNMSSMQVQLVHFLEDMASYLVAHTGTAELQRRLRPLQSCFVLNNLYHVLQGLYPSPVLGFEAEDGATLQERADLTVLSEAYARHRSQFVEQVIRVFFPVICQILHYGDHQGSSGEEGAAAAVVAQEETTVASDDGGSVGEERDRAAQEVIRAADHFILSWRTTLNNMRDVVRRLIAEPVHAQEMIAQVCMECLLVNTRFHRAIAKSIERHADAFRERPIRSLIVTNQVLLQHMRTLSSVTPAGE